MARSDMSDPVWEFIKAVPPNRTRGEKRADERPVINGISHVPRAGIPWAGPPSEYGPPTTVCNRFSRRSRAGHWGGIVDAVADAHNVDTVKADDTSIRARHSATTLKKTPAPVSGSFPGLVGDDTARPCDQDGLAIRFEPTPGQARDAPPCKTLLAGLQPGRTCARGQGL